jgi:transcription-repair coupling factor (superfamily II helicase)
MYDKSKMLNDIAIKRLQAIKEFTELGSGYRIAMRDLSIRGAGDLLGSEQAGFVDTVGIELYMQMIEEEMRRLKGEEVPEEDEDTSNKSLVEVETHIDDKYVSDEDVKIEIHKLINEIDSKKKLEEVKEELEDRFGKISSNIEIYMYEEWFEKLAKKLNITNVVQSDREITIELPEDLSNSIQGDKLFTNIYHINPRFRLKYINKKVVISLTLLNQPEHFLHYLIPLLKEIEEETT